MTDRREIILEAVLNLLATQGIEGVTHRAVDEAAGLPKGSSSYYFPKKVALLVGASHHLAKLLGKDCDDLQVGFAQAVADQGMGAAIEYVGAELVAYADEKRHLFLARMELTMAAARRRELADLGEELTAAARRPIAFFFQLVTEKSNEAAIETCAGLIDGITLMYATGQGPKPTTQQIAAVFRSIL